MPPAGSAAIPAADDAALCGDDELGYGRSRTRFTTGEGLKLDEAYRLAHLPLVAPHHPGIIAARQGTPYQMGRHERVISLVLPIPGGALARSELYRAMEAELRAAPFAHKVAWDLLPKRKGKLHVTICGSLGSEPFPFSERQIDTLKGSGPIWVELRGLFSGNLNLGRLYLRAYPERRDGDNAVRQLQRMLGRRETDLYVVGVYNLLNDLDAAEAAALSGLIESWWERPLLRFRADRLWLLGASDDLVLDSEVIRVVPLAGERSAPGDRHQPAAPP